MIVLKLYILKRLISNKTNCTLIEALTQAINNYLAGTALATVIKYERISYNK